MRDTGMLANREGVRRYLEEFISGAGYGFEGRAVASCRAMGSLDSVWRRVGRGSMARLRNNGLLNTGNFHYNCGVRTKNEKI